MSKYVKYISSDHFGSPELKGDRWGYCVELLRTCLVTGFNERTDLVKFEVLTPETVKYTFTNDHKYVEHQTIKISGTAFQELNDDSFILSTTDKEVIVKSYNDLTGLVGQSNPVTAKSIVSPLGFIEKFKDGNRSVFTTDEERAYLYIDDTKPDNWDATATNTQLICPIVYMTDKMTDIDTAGKYIFPFDITQPLQYKTRGNVVGGMQRNGIMNFLTYGVKSASGNTLANRQQPEKWTLIGNGRLFFFIPQLSERTNLFDHFFVFGRYNSSNSIKDIPYLLTGNIYINGTSSIQGAYYFDRLSKPRSFTDNVSSTESQYLTTAPYGKCFNGVLNADNKVSEVLFSAGNYNNENITGSGRVSGVSTLMQYPDKNSNKFMLNKIRMTNTNKSLGFLPGLMWVYNGSLILNNNRIVYKYKQNNKDKYFYCINSTFLNITNSSGTAQFIYMLSLDYKEWNNYE